MELLGIEIHWVRKLGAEITKGDRLKERGPFRRLRIGEPRTLYSVVLIALLIAPMVVDISVAGYSTNAFELLWLSAAATAIYIGVIVHEIMHALPYWGFREKAKIFIYPKVIFIGGYLSVQGAIPYQKLQESLWMPMWMGAALGILTAVSYLMGNPWTTQFLLMVSLLSLSAGGSDVYWSWRIHKFGSAAKYYDRGRNLDIVWKEQ